MATQFVRESVQSRLFPFRQAIEELNCRRDDGVNNFTNEEPAVERLLNSIDFILNTDVEHPGEFFEFIKCALETLPRQNLSHQPMEQVLEREQRQLKAIPPQLCDSQEKFRLWVIFSLNMVGSLKYALHLTLPMRDVLSCFVHKNSILFMDSFIDEFLGSLATLHNPPTGEGQTVFKLDVTALQLFEERPIEVHVVTKKGPGKTSVLSRSVASSRTGRTRAASKVDEPQPATSSGGGTKVKKVRSFMNGEAPPPTFVDDSTQTDESLATGDEQRAGGAVTSQLSSNVRSYLDSSTNTLHPSPLMTFQELMEAQDSFENLKNDQRAICERLKQSEEALAETKRDYQERMELLVSTLRQLKGMYNELFMRAAEANELAEELNEEDVDHRIVDIFEALKKGTRDANRETVREAMHSEAGEAANRKRAGAMTLQSPRGAPSSSTVPPPPSTASEKQSSDKLTSQSSVVAKKQAAPMTSLIINTYAGDDNNANPLPQHQIVAVDNAQLILTELTENERPRQLALQGNKCSGCGAAFGDSEDKSIVFKVVQKAGETLRLQKPRRCHYCVRLFCHRCHTNKMAAIPCRVLSRWDFSPQHVCNKDYEFLTKNYERAFYFLPSLPQELQSRPNIQQCAFLRKKLMLLARIMLSCSDESSSPFASFLHSHYALKEFFYSLADFSRLRTGEGNRLLMAAATPINAVGSLVAHAAGGHSSSTEDLIAFLTTQFTRGMQHVKECRQCVARTSMRCGMCTEASLVSIVDDDSKQCKGCLSVYHAACFETMSCPVCTNRR